MPAPARPPRQLRSEPGRVPVPVRGARAGYKQGQLLRLSPSSLTVRQPARKKQQQRREGGSPSQSLASWYTTKRDRRSSRHGSAVRHGSAGEPGGGGGRRGACRAQDPVRRRAVREGEALSGKNLTSIYRSTCQAFCGDPIRNA